MSLMMNGEDMNRMLEELRPEGETYTGKAWGTIMGGTITALALGALSNVYCYVGVTENSLVIATLETFDISHIYGKVCLPFTDIKALKIGRGIIPSQRIIKLKADGLKLKLSLVNNSITARGIDQTSGMNAILSALERFAK